MIRKKTLCLTTDHVQLKHSTLVLLTLLNGALLHAQNVADGVELELLAELLADAFFHKLVPIKSREGSDRKNKAFVHVFYAYVLVYFWHYLADMTSLSQ